MLAHKSSGICRLVATKLNSSG
jgi:hypothetical protein